MRDNREPGPIHKKRNYLQGDIRVPTLLAKVYKEHSPSASCFDLGDMVQSLLRSAGPANINVEIANETRAFVPSIFPQA